MNKKDSYYFRKITNLLKLRAKEFPKKGPAFHKLQNLLEEYTKFLLKTKYDLSIEKNVLEKKNFNFQKSPIFICGSMKSGTTLLLNLLDSKKILTLPGDSHYFNINFDKFCFKDLATYWIKRLINPTGQPPFWFLGKNTDNYREFLNYLDNLEKSLNDKFLAVVTAIYLVLNKEKK